jgi:hypothetical protein
MRASREEFHGEKVRHSLRTHFLEIRGSGSKKRPVIVESKRVKDGAFERQRVEVPLDCLEVFLDGLDDLLIRAGIQKQRNHEVHRLGRKATHQSLSKTQSETQTFDHIRSEYPKAYMPWSTEDDAILTDAYKSCKWLTHTPILFKESRLRSAPA